MDSTKKKEDENKRDAERNGTKSEWNATRDDDARTDGTTDAMAKYYGDIAKAAKGTFAGSRSIDEDADGCDATRGE